MMERDAMDKEDLDRRGRLKLQRESLLKEIKNKILRELRTLTEKNFFSEGGVNNINKEFWYKKFYLARRLMNMRFALTALRLILVSYFRIFRKFAIRGGIRGVQNHVSI